MNCTKCGHDRLQHYRMTRPSGSRRRGPWLPCQALVTTQDQRLGTCPCRNFSDKETQVSKPIYVDLGAEVTVTLTVKELMLAELGLSGVADDLEKAIRPPDAKFVDDSSEALIGTSVAQYRQTAAKVTAAIDAEKRRQAREIAEGRVCPFCGSTGVQGPSQAMLEDGDERRVCSRCLRRFEPTSTVQREEDEEGGIRLAPKTFDILDGDLRR